MYSLSLILGQIYNCGVKLVLKTKNMIMFFLIKRLHKIRGNKNLDLLVANLSRSRPEKVTDVIKIKSL